MLFRYVLRSLLARRVSTAIAIAAIGLVIGASVFGVAFYNGLRANMASTGRDDNIVIVEAGVLQTTKSLLTKTAIDKLEVMSGVAQHEGKPMVSPEAHMEMPVEDTDRSVAVRGVEPMAYLVHDQVKITEGREPAPGSNELLLGKRLVDSQPDWKVGGTVRVGNERWPVVGVFSAGGSALEREIWGDRNRLGVQLKLSELLCAIVRAESDSAVPGLISAVDGIRLGEGKGTARAMTERKYYETTLGNLDMVVKAVSIVVLVLMFGAVFAAANTLHASLSARMSEFAALWVVGHKRRRLLSLIFQEAVLLSLAAAVVGCALSLIYAGQQVKTVLGGSLEFQLPFGAPEALTAVALALVIACLGAAYPAMQVLRRDLTEDLS